MVYLEQIYIKFLNLVDNLYWQYYNTASEISRCGTFLPFLSLVNLFLVLPSNFIFQVLKDQDNIQF